MVNQLKHVYTYRTPIPFKSCTVQCGEIGYKEKPIFPNGKPVLKVEILVEKKKTDKSN